MGLQLALLARQPVAHIRKSRVFDERNGISWEVQEAKVRELAAQYGDDGGQLIDRSRVG